MVALRFDYRDLFRAPRLAFSFQRIWIQFLGLASGYAGYVVLTYIAFLLAGESLGGIWSRFGLLPSAFGTGLPWYAWIISVLGVVVLAIAWLVTATAVSRAAYMNLKGNTFYTWKEAFAFARKKAGSVVATPVAVLVIIGLIVLVGMFVGVFGRIPWSVGDVLGVGISLLSPVWYAVSLFLVFVGLALLVALVLTPAVLATTDDDAFEGIFQSFSVLASQPWRLVVYEILVKLLSLAGFLVFAFFAKRAWGIMTTILTWGMGDKFATLSFAATNTVQGWVLPAADWARYLAGDISNVFLFSHELMSVDLPAVQSVSSFVLAVFVLLIGMAVVSYPLAAFNVGNTLLFMVLKKKKDDENLLERKDKEEETEDEAEADEKKEEKTAKAGPKSRRAVKRARPKKRPAVRKKRARR
jgi:hypothetical protein